MKLYGKPKKPTIYKFDSEGNAINSFQLLGDSIISGGARVVSIYNDSTLLTGFSYRFDNPPDSGRSEIIQTDTLGNYINKRLLLSQTTSPEGVIETTDHKIAVLGCYYTPPNWDIYLWKLNSDLQDDTLNTLAHTYDSLCPYTITSDTIDPDCNLFVNIEEIPTKDEYEGNMEIWPVPAKHMITIKLPQSNPFQKFSLTTQRTLMIWNSCGNLVHNKQIPFQKDILEMDISPFASGVYIALLWSNKSIIARKKFIVSN